MSSTLELQLNPNESGAFDAFSVLVVDDEIGIQAMLGKALRQWFTKVDSVGSVEDAECLRSQHHYDLIILDVNLPGRSGIEWHEAFAARDTGADVILMTGYADLDTAIAAIKLGASDFILKPFHLKQMLHAVEQCMMRRVMERKQRALEKDLDRRYPNNILGASAQTQLLKQRIAQYAPSKAAVLIEGESGTGKELVARGLHQASQRSGAFVPVNCAAIAPELLESELFGHTSGAFTGAGKTREGLFRVASGGTLFLDEIGEMPLNMQSALLRVLEQKAIRPVGGEHEIAVDLRVVAATNRNLEQQVQLGQFRADLYYRLNALKIDVLPLRARKLDLQELVPFFTRILARDLGIESPKWAHQDHQAMHDYHWPGNIRELKNVLERCMLLGEPPADYLGQGQRRDPAPQWVNIDRMSSTFAAEHTTAAGYPSSWSLKQVEKAHIQQLVEMHDGNKSAAARALGVARKTLERKFRDWDCDEPLDAN